MFAFQRHAVVMFKRPALALRRCNGVQKHARRHKQYERHARRASVGISGSPPK